MSEQAATWQSATVAEAATVLGVSTATVRRMVRRGQLEGERVHRPQGVVYVVRLPADAASTVEHPSGTRQGPGDAPRGSVQGDERSQAMATWAASLLVPIAAELGQARQTIERQAERLEVLAETNGRLGEQVANRERELGRLTAELEQARTERDVVEASRRREHRRLRIGLVAAGALAVAATLAPSWVR